MYLQLPCEALSLRHSSGYIQHQFFLCELGLTRPTRQSSGSDQLPIFQSSGPGLWRWRKRPPWSHMALCTSQRNPTACSFLITHKPRVCAENLDDSALRFEVRGAVLLKLFSFIYSSPTRLNLCCSNRGQCFMCVKGKKRNSFCPPPHYSESKNMC